MCEKEDNQTSNWAFSKFWKLEEKLSKNERCGKDFLGSDQFSSADFLLWESVGQALSGMLASLMADLFRAQRKYLKLSAPEECELLQATAYATFFICPITSLLQNRHLK